MLSFTQLESCLTLRNQIEIFQQFVNAVGTRQSGNNFNKYYDIKPPTYPQLHPLISIRMNLTDEQGAWREIQKTADQLITSNQTRWYSSLKDWTEPSFVVKAHETGTACAVKFKEQLDLNKQTYQKLARNPDDFMWLFAVSLC